MARPRKLRDAEDARAKLDRRCSASRIAFLAGVSSQSVTNARAEGAPRNKDGTMSWPEVRAWAQANGRLGYVLPKSSTVVVGSAEDYDTAIKRLKAAAAQREHDVAMGSLIPRVDAVRAQMALALEFKAALLQLPDQLSTPLADLPAREVEKILRDRVAYILGNAQDGQLPIPAAISEAIARMVAECQPQTQETTA